LKRAAQPLLLAALALAVAACRQDMHDQAKYQPYEASTFFADGRASRPAVPGTVARGRLDLDEHFHGGRVDGEFAAEFPLPIDRALLERGRERYAIFCTPCHGLNGDGDGMIVQRGMIRPEPFHLERLLEAPPGYFFDVMTRGFGAMWPYDDRVTPADRWAIAAWIRVLQRSYRGRLEDVPDAVRRAMLASREAGGGG
jgi:hypothetical protein